MMRHSQKKNRFNYSVIQMQYNINTIQKIRVAEQIYYNK